METKGITYHFITSFDHGAVHKNKGLLDSPKLNELILHELDRPKPKQAGYSWRLFIPMKTQLTDTSPLTLVMLL